MQALDQTPKGQDSRGQKSQDPRRLGEVASRGRFSRETAPPSLILVHNVGHVPDPKSQSLWPAGPSRVQISALISTAQAWMLSRHFSEWRGGP